MEIIYQPIGSPEKAPTMTRVVGSWRELIEVHAASDLFPQMSDDEIAELARDIKENGLLQEITLFTSEQPEPEHPKQLQLLDGRKRLDATWRAETDTESRLKAVEDVLGRARIGWGDTNPYEYVVSLKHVRSDGRRTDNPADFRPLSRPVQRQVDVPFCGPAPFGDGKRGGRAVLQQAASPVRSTPGAEARRSQPALR